MIVGIAPARHCEPYSMLFVLLLARSVFSIDNQQPTIINPKRDVHYEK